MPLRVGIGYDSHRLVEGRAAGARAASKSSTTGASTGHSDADVLTHAVIDALLGACGLGDLGELFPDTEEQWRDADSIDLLRIVIGQMSGAVANVDVTVICEEPKLEPYKAEISSTLDRGPLGAGQRQGLDQRGHGRDRPGRGNRLHGGGPGRHRRRDAARLTEFRPSSQ